MTHYAERKPWELDRAGGYYHRHVAAMTEEGLHSKADIAAELGWRDMEIDRLQSQFAWHPVSKGLPPAPGHYIFASHGSIVHAGLVETGSWFTPDGESHEPRAWAHYRRIELPKDGES